MKQIHKVEVGDTLSKIAQQYDVTVQKLIDWNKDAYPTLEKRPDLIYVNWVLVVGSPKIHEVKHGDTLGQLADLYSTSIEQLILWNEKTYPSIRKNPDHIVVGWKLKVGQEKKEPTYSILGRKVVTTKDYDKQIEELENLGYEVRVYEGDESG